MVLYLNRTPLNPNLFLSLRPVSKDNEPKWIRWGPYGFVYTFIVLSMLQIILFQNKIYLITIHFHSSLRNEILFLFNSFFSYLFYLLMLNEIFFIFLSWRNIFFQYETIFIDYIRLTNQHQYNIYLFFYSPAFPFSFSFWFPKMNQTLLKFYVKVLLSNIEGKWNKLSSLNRLLKL